jgi:EAL domain-containing protein (putative c-di-GMP-specific phosphodiesterase class I)/GGDEF domain-containing protein
LPLSLNSSKKSSAFKATLGVFMTLSKQLLILISVIFLILISINFAISVKNFKSYLEDEGQIHAQDTATSLGLSLSPYMNDTSDPIIKTMVSAIFDMGYYKEIRLVDAGKIELISLSNGKAIDRIPVWFVEYFPMSTITAKSEISFKWALRGTLYVTINPSLAYSKLYDQAKNLLSYSLLTFVLSIILLVLLLRMTLTSLNKINQLALRITEGHFEIIGKLPWTTEIKNITISINTMSQKIKSTIAALNNKLDALGASLLCDDLSGLYKKSVFETDIMNLMMAYTPAYFFIIKLDSLPDLIRERGNVSIDQFLKAFAAKLKNTCEQYPNVIIRPYRFYGGEFALLVNNGNIEQIESIAQSLNSDIAELGQLYFKPDLVHIGVVHVNSVCTPKSILDSAYEAYEQARLIGVNSYYIRSNDDFSRDILNWKELVFNCIDKADYSLTYISKIIAFQNEQLIMEEASAQVYDSNNQLVAIGPFISIAEELAKIVDLDKGVINMVLDYIDRDNISHAIAVNLSIETIKNIGFRLWLEKLIKINPLITQQIVFSFSTYAVAKQVEAYRDFIEVIHHCGGRVMIKRFDSQSMSLEFIKSLKPDFIRLSREISNGVSVSLQKYEFIQAMQQMGFLLDIAILAENVQLDTDYYSLKSIGITGASR